MAFGGDSSPNVLRSAAERIHSTLWDKNGDNGLVSLGAKIQLLVSLCEVLGTRPTVNPACGLHANARKEVWVMYADTPGSFEHSNITL